ncbi:MAG TPA: Pycsar system effector family protein [Candidatus Saccharimonadales bacterium]
MVSNNRNTDKDGVEFSWKVHSAITDWTAKVDTKASIILSLGGVVLGFIIALSTNHRILTNLYGWRALFRVAGLTVFSLGVVLAALVVMPRLGRRKSKREWEDNYIYFGHLRHWKPKDLKKKLRNMSTDDLLNALSKQLVTTSKVAWYKHSLLQFAMICYLVGALLVLIAAIWR